MNETVETLFDAYLEGEGMTELTAEAPEAEMQDFALVLRQITQGLGEFTAEFARYDMAATATV